MYSASSSLRHDEYLAVARPIAKAFAPFIADYRRLLKRLRADGLRVRWTSLVAPVQLEGHLPSGESFLFHCRHDTCTLWIASPRRDPVISPSWKKALSEWGRDEAGALTADEAESVLRRLLDAYANREVAP